MLVRSLGRRCAHRELQQKLTSRPSSPYPSHSHYPPPPFPYPPRPSPQILASIASAVRAFIKGGGLKRLLEAVTPRTAHAVHADTGPIAKCPLFPIDRRMPVLTQTAKCLSAAVYTPASKRLPGKRVRIVAHSAAPVR